MSFRSRGDDGIEIEMKVPSDTVRARVMDDTKIWAALALPGEAKIGIEDPRALEALATTVEDQAHRRWLVSNDEEEHMERILPRLREHWG